jgi:hypothetical protein
VQYYCLPLAEEGGSSCYLRTYYILPCRRLHPSLPTQIARIKNTTRTPYLTTPNTYGYTHKSERERETEREHPCSLAYPRCKSNGITSGLGRASAMRRKENPEKKRDGRRKNQREKKETLATPKRPHSLAHIPTRSRNIVVSTFTFHTLTAHHTCPSAGDDPVGRSGSGFIN